MIPAQFDYVRPASVDEAVAALTEARRRRQGDRRRAVAAAVAPDPVGRAERAGRLRPDRRRCAGSPTPATRCVIGAATTHHDVMHDRAGARACGAAGDRPRPPSPTRRSGTAAPSAGRSPTPTRPVTCRRWRWRWTRRWSIAGPGGRREVAAADFFVDYFTTALSSGRGAGRGAGAQARRRLGLRLPEVPPDGAVLGDRRGARPRCAGRTARSPRPGWG